MLLGRSDAVTAMRNQAIGAATTGVRVPRWIIGRLGDGARRFYRTSDFNLSGMEEVEWERLLQHGTLARQRCPGPPGKCWCRC